MNLEKKVHHFTNGHKQELVRLFSEGGMITGKMKKAIENVTSSFVPSAKSGRPESMEKLSLKHVNEDLDDNVQAQFFTVKYHEGNYNIRNIGDTRTVFEERSIVESSNEQAIMSKLEGYALIRI